MNSCIPQSQEEEILINETIRRTPHRPNEDFISSTHATRISMMSSEESPRPHPPSSALSTNSENCEDENTWKTLINFTRCKMEQFLAFSRSHYGTMELLLFWMFLPISLPLFIFKTVVYDFIKIRQIFVLTLECVIMQLQLIFEMMSCIQRSNSPIDVKVEKMGRTFHFLNMFNPVHWIGMLQFYADHNMRSSLVPANVVHEESQRKNNHLTFADETIVLSGDEEDQKVVNGNLDQGSEGGSPVMDTKYEKKVRSKSRDENSNLSSHQSIEDDDLAVVENTGHDESF